MNYADIKRVDVANGPGVRVSLFVSGCPHRCPGCFNPETWDDQFGSPYTPETADLILRLLAPGHIRGLSLLGGEPFAPHNQEPLLKLVERIRHDLPEKNIWCYTGYLYEDLAAGSVGNADICRALLSQLDILVDGPFLLAEKSLNLPFRGSKNQRILQVKESLCAGRPLLWEETFPR